LKRPRTALERRYYAYVFQELNGWGQAKGARIIEHFDLMPDEARAPVFEQMPDEAFEPMRDELLELMRDALQCATEASSFLLKQLTSLDGRRGDLVSKRLEEFARRWWRLSMGFSKTRTANSGTARKQPTERPSPAARATSQRLPRRTTSTG